MCTSDMDADVVVDLPKVIAKVNTIDSRIRALTRADQELGMFLPLGDDLPTSGLNTIFKPGDLWRRRTLEKQKTVLENPVE